MEESKNQNEIRADKTFALAGQTIFIFALPAIVGAFVGRKIDATFQTGYIITIIILCATFILSWAVIILKYITLSKNIKKSEGLTTKEKK